MLFRSRSAFEGIEPGRSGMAFEGEDFLDGELRAFEQNEIEIRSVLFGNRKLPLEKAFGLMLRKVEGGRRNWEVYLADGSSIFAKEIALTRGGVRVADSEFGGLEIPANEIVRMERVDRRLK